MHCRDDLERKKRTEMQNQKRQSTRRKMQFRFSVCDSDKLLLGVKAPFLAASLISAPDYFDERHFLLE